MVRPVWVGEREAKVKALHERLVSAVGVLVSGEDWVRAMVFAARFRSRSFGNTVLIYAQHAERFAVGSVSEPMPSYVAGFRQWESLGRSVLKGQRGYVIQAPVTKRLASDSPSSPDSWRVLGFKERAKPGEVVRSRIVNVKPAYVWDVCQTEGDPIPVRPVPAVLAGEAPEGLWDGLRALVEAEGFTVGLVDSAGEIHGANGVTDFAERAVRVRSDMDAAARVKTLAHELGHVRMHDPDDALSWSHRGVGEVEAESVAMMVAAAHGMPTDSYTIPYVSSWASTVKGRTAAEVVQATGERVRAQAVAILAGLDTAQVGAGDPPGLDRATVSAGRAKSAEVSTPTRVSPVADRGMVVTS
ncbi:MAG: ImmA/IrrE family metallo-endopeptidase [Propionibacteriaceae bacterium]|jgi:head-tail adaptor|nr:ImmA/IrrE family metallo-endopeptidase [Propionibacteriaceae bacterium]